MIRTQNIIVLILMSIVLFACSNTEERHIQQSENDLGKNLSKAESGTNLTNDSTDDSSDDHVHDLWPFEWSAIYGLQEGTYTLNFNQNQFGDESILIAFIIENKNITDPVHHAAHLFETPSETIKEKNEFIAIHEHAYNLLLNMDRTEFSFKIEESGSYIIFTEHHAEEFLMTILNQMGEEILPQNPTEYESGEHVH